MTWTNYLFEKTWSLCWKRNSFWCHWKIDGSWYTPQDIDVASMELIQSFWSLYIYYYIVLYWFYGCNVNVLCIHCLPDAPTQKKSSIDRATMIHMDIKVTSSRWHSAKGLSKTFDYSVVSMVTNLWRHWCRRTADSIKSLKMWWSMADNLCLVPSNFQWLYKLKFY